jgi:hypothetical protein
MPILDLRKTTTVKLTQGPWMDTVTYRAPIIGEWDYIKTCQELNKWYGTRQHVSDVRREGDEAIYDVSWSIGD